MRRPASPAKTYHQRAVSLPPDHFRFADHRLVARHRGVMRVRAPAAAENAEWKICTLRFQGFDLTSLLAQRSLLMRT